MPISEEILQKIRDNDVTLTSLNLRDNHIGPAEAQALATALENNTTLTSLNLGANQIGPAGAQALATALENNTTLTSLDLEDNQIGPTEAQALADALKVNTTLTSLNLEVNYIGPEGVQALATALENNTTLTSLNLEVSYIGPEELNAIEAIIQRNINMIPKISEVMSRIISEAPEERLSDPQIRFISNKHRPENCVRILENLVRNVPNDDIQDVLQRIQNMPGEMGAMILFTASKAQESDLPQNKLDLPEDRLIKVKELLKDQELKNLFKAKGVAKDGGLSKLLNADVEKYILGYLEKEDIKTPSPTVLNPSEEVNLVESANNNPKGCCTIS